MQIIKLNGSDIALRGSGVTALIFTDELHKDIFGVMNSFVNNISHGKIEISEIAMLVYAFAKTANPEIYKSYRSFMESTTQIGQFASQNLITAVVAEINEMMDTGEKPAEESKKKTVKTTKKA